MKKEKKNILVVGGSDGIGLRVIERLLREGNSVYNISRSACPAKGAVSISGDFSKSGEAEKCLEEESLRGVKMDALVWCAGNSFLGEALETDRKSASQVMNLNFDSITEMIIAYGKNFRTGKIIVVSDMSAYFPVPYAAFKNAAAAAIVAFCRTCYSDWKKQKSNLQITCIPCGGAATQYSRKRQIFGETNGGNLSRAASALTELEQTGILADSVAILILELLDKAKLPAKAHTSWRDAAALALSRLLPERMVDWAVGLKFEQKKVKKEQPKKTVKQKPAKRKVRANA